MAVLEIAPNINGVDDVYERLLSLHEGRTLEESFRIAARLNLILLNHIGDRAVIDQAFAHAVRRTAETPASREGVGSAAEGEPR